MITGLKLKDFTAFKVADFTFGSKLNIIVGANGTGKTQLLKILYAWSQGAFAPTAPRLGKNATEMKAETYFHGLFKCDDDLKDLVNYDAQAVKGRKASAVLELRFRQEEQDYVSKLKIVPPDIIVTPAKWKMQPDSKIGFSFPSLENGVFLQARETLTMYPGYFSLDQRYHLPYDSTFGDTISKLGMPYLRNVPKDFEMMVKEIREVIHGDIYLKNERFYYHADTAPEDSEQDINLAAEGWRKLGELMQLLRNGELHSGMALFWDEPDSNLNPQLARYIAAAIIRLANLGIQVFITTQSLFFLRELEYLSNQEAEKGLARYFSLSKEGIEQADCTADLQNILSFEEEIREEDRILGTGRGK